MFIKPANRGETIIVVNWKLGINLRLLIRQVVSLQICLFRFERKQFHSGRTSSGVNASFSVNISLPLLFCAIIKTWNQNLPRKWAISVVFFWPMFANCVYTKTMFVHVSEREIFFSLNSSKFAVKCHWKSKNSRNVQNLVFFGN